MQHTAFGECLKIPYYKTHTRQTDTHPGAVFILGPEGTRRRGSTGGISDSEHGGDPARFSRPPGRSWPRGRPPHPLRTLQKLLSQRAELLESARHSSLSFYAGPRPTRRTLRRSEPRSGRFTTATPNGRGRGLGGGLRAATSRRAVRRVKVQPRPSSPSLSSSACAAADAAVGLAALRPLGRLPP